MSESIGSFRRRVARKGNTPLAPEYAGAPHGKPPWQDQLAALSPEEEKQIGDDPAAWHAAGMPMPGTDEWEQYHDKKAVGKYFGDSTGGNSDDKTPPE